MARAAVRVVNRLLAVPAVLCLVVGGLLGVWGWGQRDEARARIIPDSDDDGEPSVFGLEPGPHDEGRRQLVCEVLFAAANLEVPYDQGLFPTSSVPQSGGPTSSSPGGAPADPSEGWAIVAVLDPSTVSGVSDLDQRSVLSAMARQQRAMERALRNGREPSTDAAVLDAASNLGLALSNVC